MMKLQVKHLNCFRELELQILGGHMLVFATCLLRAPARFASRSTAPRLLTFTSDAPTSARCNTDGPDP